MLPAYQHHVGVLIVEEASLGHELRRLLRDRPVLLFENIEAFDVWRARTKCAETIDRDVAAALEELRCDTHLLPSVIRLAMERLAERECAPAVNALVPPGVSERTFYRRWIAQVPVRPKRFLDLVRMYHAVRLIDCGFPSYEAAFRAGYSSHAQFRRAAGKHRVCINAPA